MRNSISASPLESYHIYSKGSRSESH